MNEQEIDPKKEIEQCERELGALWLFHTMYKKIEEHVPVQKVIIRRGDLEFESTFFIMSDGGPMIAGQQNLQFKNKKELKNAIWLIMRYLENRGFILPIDNIKPSGFEFERYKVE